MAERPTLLICGLGRCGTSLMMQMLAKGGVPTVGRWPSYEKEASRLLPDRLGVEWLRAVAPGHAVKLLDPFRWTPPADLPARIIWMDRETDQQAASQMKIVAQLTGVTIDGCRRRRRALEATLVRDRRQSLAALAAPMRPWLRLNFEDLIEHPLVTAEAVGRFIAPLFELDPVKAAAVVIPRAANCLPGLLEAEMIAEWRVW